MEANVPTYQYACTVCGHRLEAVQSFSDDPLSVCPECTGKLRKVFSAVGVVFKGSGFYRTDSRNGSNGSNGANGKAPSDGATSDGAKSDGAKSDGASTSAKSDAGSGKSDSGSSAAKSTAAATS
jgi:putative FmdB family regulatory protein